MECKIHSPHSGYKYIIQSLCEDIVTLQQSELVKVLRCWVQKFVFLDCVYLLSCIRAVSCESGGRIYQKRFSKWLCLASVRITLLKCLCHCISMLATQYLAPVFNGVHMDIFDSALFKYCWYWTRLGASEYKHSLRAAVFRPLKST